MFNTFLPNLIEFRLLKPLETCQGTLAHLSQLSERHDHFLNVLTLTLLNYFQYINLDLETML